MDSEDILRKVLAHEEETSISLSTIQLFVLVAHLQVSQRYLNGGSGAIAKQLIDKFIDLVSDAVPEARELLEMGNDPSLDITKEYFDNEF